MPLLFRMKEGTQNNLKPSKNTNEASLKITTFFFGWERGPRGGFLFGEKNLNPENIILKYFQNQFFFDNKLQVKTLPK